MYLNSYLIAGNFMGIIHSFDLMKEKKIQIQKYTQIQSSSDIKDYKNTLLTLSL